MNEEILKRYADLWDDEGWCLLRAQNVPGGFVPFHVEHSTMKVIEDSSLNQAVCERLRALGRPELEDLPPSSMRDVQVRPLDPPTRR